MRKLLALGLVVAVCGAPLGAEDKKDPTNGKWAVTEARWGPRDKWDELTIVLKRQNPGRGKERPLLVVFRVAVVQGDDEALRSAHGQRLTGVSRRWP